MNYGPAPRRNEHQVRVRAAIDGFMAGARALSPADRRALTRAPSKPKPGSERAIQTAILAALPKLCGIIVVRQGQITTGNVLACHQGARGIAWRNNRGTQQIGGRWVRFGIDGQADISGVLRGGRRLEIEVKRPGQRQSPAQVAFQQAIEALGGLYVVATSVEDVVRGLARKGER